MNALIDTGFLFATIDAEDSRHTQCVKALENEFVAPLLPEVVLSELAYLLLRDLNYQALIIFLRSLAEGELPIVSVSGKDLNRAAEILDQCEDSKIDFVDSVIMAIVEQLNNYSDSDS